MMARYREKTTTAYHELSALIEDGVAALSAARILIAKMEGLPGGVDATPSQALSKRVRDTDTITAKTRRSPKMRQDSARVSAQDRLLQRMPRAGRNGVAILQRLMDEPDCDVASEELVHTAGIRSIGIQVVKVYICHLRRELEANGIDPKCLVTGHRSYRLQSTALPAIAALLA